MNKRYYLKNENGEILDINDFENSVFNLTSDLGTSKQITYNRIENTFVKNTEEQEQGKIEGQVKFIKSEIENEENYKKYEQFIKLAKTLTFVNIRKEKSGTAEYHTDVDYVKLGRKFERGSFLISELVLNCITPWYKQNETIYTIEENQNKLFGFPIDFENMVFGTGNKNNRLIENDGFSEAPFYIKIRGPILNPKIQILKNKEILNSLEIGIELLENEELEYCTRDDKLLIRKIKNDGSYENLFDLIDINNDSNFFKLPQGVSNLQIIADTDIKYAQIIIYFQR